MYDFQAPANLINIAASGAALIRLALQPKHTRNPPRKAAKVRTYRRS